MQKPGPSVFKLEGVIKHYDWGGTSFLSELLSIPNAKGKPMAEYWLGAHPLSSSSIITENGQMFLKEFIAGNKDKALGRSVAKKFGELPYLLKILDVKDLLSIQVHPSKHEAEVGFAKETADGIPLHAFNRNYKDDNHKPELVVALDEFWLLHGFKPAEKLVETMRTIPGFSSLFEIFASTGYDQLYKTVMEMPQQTVNEILQPLIDRIIPLYQNNQLERSDENFWAARAAVIFNEAPNIDRGIFSVYFFNLVHLKKGEGIFQDAGTPHSYLEGRNIEIMSNSDNVLRGGLTKKHIDVKELMRHIKFEETIPNILHPKKAGDENVFLTAAPDFKLSQYHLEEGKETALQTVTGEIILVIDGKISVRSGNDKLDLSKGEAAFVLAGVPLQIRSFANANVFRASSPVHSGE
jgi:mannose-6-phosphate isomerase